MIWNIFVNGFGHCHMSHNWVRVPHPKSQSAFNCSVSTVESVKMRCVSVCHPDGRIGRSIWQDVIIIITVIITTTITLSSLAIKLHLLRFALGNVLTACLLPSVCVDSLYCTLRPSCRSYKWLSHLCVFFLTPTQGSVVNNDHRFHHKNKCMFMTLRDTS